MKLKNAIYALAIAFTMGLFLNSCDPDSGTGSGPVNPTKTAVEEVKNLQAANDSTGRIIIKYSIPTTVDNSAGYNVYIDGGKLNDKPFSMNTNEITISKITTGKKFLVEVEVAAKDTTKFTNSKKVSIQWAAADRFDTDYAGGEIKIAESASDKFGSGILLFDAVKGGPRVLKIADIVDWTVGVYTKGDDFFFGPASKLNNGEGNYAKNKKTVEIAGPYDYNSFKEMFSNKDLAGLTYVTTPYNLKSHTANTSALFVIRETIEGKKFYAKVLVKKTNGSFTTGNSPNRVFELSVSYQKTADLPFAKGR